MIKSFQRLKMEKIFTYTTGSDRETKHRLSILAGRGRGIMQWKMQVTSEIQNIQMSSMNKWKLSTYFLKVKSKTMNITWRTLTPPKYQHWERFNIHHSRSHAKGCDCLQPMNHATRHTVMHTTHTMCCTTPLQTQVVGIIYTAANIYLLKPCDYFTYHPV
jgi:hypothetical protein